MEPLEVITAGCAASVGIHDEDGGLNSLNLFCETVLISTQYSDWC